MFRTFIFNVKVQSEFSVFSYLQGCIAYALLQFLAGASSSLLFIAQNYKKNFFITKTCIFFVPD